MINTSRSERGWQGRRRIAVLVSIAGVLGVAALGTATTASAATVANCNAKLTPKGKSSGTQANLSFVCDAPVRAYGVGSNKTIKDYGATNAPFMSCEGSGAGFGCGISDRAAPGTQTPGTTGWSAAFPPNPSATGTPTTCGGYTRTAGAGTGNTDPDNDGQPGPNVNSIVGQPCTQLIPAGTKVTQSIKLGSSPCAGGLQVSLFVGGEPAVTGLVPPTSLESTTVGEFISSPIPVSLKAYKGCQGGSGKSGKGKKSSAPPTKYPISCTGSVGPAAAPGNNTVTFTCSQNLRAFAIYSNKPIALPGDEPLVTGTNGGGNNEGALHQCEGALPGPGYGCGIVDRQAQSAPSGGPPPNPGLPNGQGITAGNTVSQTMGFDSAPCQRPGQPKTKVWIVPMGEPITSATTVGEFIAAPQQLAVAVGKCKGGKKK